MKIRIEKADPQGPDALSLLRDAAIDARALYPEIHTADAPWPTNDSLGERAAYIVCYCDDQPAACAAIRTWDESTAELKRMYVREAFRRHGLANFMMDRLTEEARQLGYSSIRLETGTRQQPAVRLYESYGFTRIPAFGEHVADPFALCFELRLN